MLRGEKVILMPYTKELWHEFYSNYVSDPSMGTTPYLYNFEQAEKNFASKTRDISRLYFVILKENIGVIGEIYLKHIDMMKVGFKYTHEDSDFKYYVLEQI